MPKEYNEGQKYLYYDNQSTDTEFSIHESINDVTSPFVRTIEQVKETKSQDYMVMFWND